MSNDLHHIVIVGGGAGGLELATQLGNTLGKQKQARITLVDRQLTHIWKPLLHEVAAGTLNAHEEEVNYFAHATKHHFEFVVGTMIDLQRQEKFITLQNKLSTSNTEDTQNIAYDTLVLSVGSVSNDFKTTGVKDHCYFLDSREQADNFQKDLLSLYLEAQNSRESRDLNIAIVGAGATGVELAAELHQAKYTFHKYGLNKINPKQVKITLVEAGPKILSALSPSVSRHAYKQLLDFKIEVLRSHRVEKVDAESIYFQDGTSIKADLKVWCAGIKMPQVIENLTDFEKDNLGRLKVFATLQTQTDPNIFAFGDCAHCQPEAQEQPLGPRAQVASQQASFLVDALKAHVRGQSIPMFKFTDKGSLISLSHNNAVGELLGQVNVQGFVAKSMYVSLYRLHQAAIHGYTQAGIITAKDFITRRIGPKIKLH